MFMYEQDNQQIPLISVIMSAYNAEAFIVGAITSVQAQSLKDWELLVIDDGSIDNTCGIIEEFVQRDNRIHLIKNDENFGVAKTRNIGMEIFHGKYVAFLDSDDYWYPEMLEKMVARAEETDADIVYCSYELVDESGKKVCNDFLVPTQTTFKESIVRSVITCSTVLITRELARTYRFPTNMYHEDIAMWFQILRDGGKAYGVTDILAAYRQRRGSRSASKVKSAFRRWKIYRKHLKMPFLQSVWVLVRYAYYGIIKFRRI